MRLYRPRDPAAPAGAAAPCGRGRMALGGDGFGRGLGATTAGRLAGCASVPASVTWLVPARCL